MAATSRRRSPVSDNTAYLDADAADARAALANATQIVASRGDCGFDGGDGDWLRLAERGYRFLRARDSLRAVSLQLIPGTPYKEGSTPVTATFDLSDTYQVVFSLTGLDAKDAAVPLPAGFTATWSLADPDSTGATLTASADTTTATLAAGVPDSNLMVSVSVAITNPDGSTTTLAGAEAVIVQASDATTVGLVAGTPAPES
jgi:hypothetical protein